jgi:hypothetical protein
MKLWIGAETQADIVDDFRVIRKEIESGVNYAINGKTYDIEIEG